MARRLWSEDDVDLEIAREEAAEERRLESFYISDAD